MSLVRAETVREHVRRLRKAGGTYETIGHAAGIGAMTVHCIANGRRPKVQARVADKLLAISPADIRDARPRAGGIALRLQALIAMGHCCTRMAAAIGVPPATLRRIVRGGRSPSAPSCGRRSSRCTQPGGTSARHGARARRTSPPITPSNALP